MNGSVHIDVRFELLRAAFREGVRRNGLSMRGAASFPGSNEGEEYSPVKLGGGKPDAVVICRIEAVYRSEAVRNFIGDRILKFKASRWFTKGGGQLMLAMYFDRFPPSAAGDLEEYARIYLHGHLNWLIVSADGQVVSRLFNRDEAFRVEPCNKGKSAKRSEPARMSLLNERHQWLFKCLLLPGIGKPWWGGPDRQAVSISDLAELSGVPQPAVSIFVQKAEAAGYLVREHRGFRIVRHRELLEEWSFAAKYRPSPAWGVRPIVEEPSLEKWLERLRGKRSVVIGSHLACHSLGVGRSNNRGMVFYCRDDQEKIMAELELLPDELPSPWARLIKPRFAPCIFVGAVERDAFLLVDILQAYLDVRHSPARGMEQAEFIYMSRLRPHFERS